MNQQKFDRYNYDKQEFLDDLNNKWNDDEKWRFENNKLVLNENDGWNSNSWIVIKNPHKDKIKVKYRRLVFLFRLILLKFGDKYIFYFYSI